MHYASLPLVVIDLLKIFSDKDPSDLKQNVKLSINGNAFTQVDTTKTTP